MPVKQPKPVTIDGVTYESYSQADRELGLPKGATSKRVARELAQAGAQPEAVEPYMDAVEAPAPAGEQQVEAEIAPSDELAAAAMDEPATEPERTLTYWGVTYGTRREMADALDLEYLKLNAYLRKYDSVDEAVEKCMAGETSLSINYGGDMYRSFKALCEALKITPGLVRAVAALGGTDRMDAFKDLVALREQAEIREDVTLSFVPYCVLEGTPYRSMKELASHFEVEPADMAKAIGEWGVEEGLQKLRDRRVMAYSLDGGNTFIPRDQLLRDVDNDQMERFELTRKPVPEFPKLQDIDLCGQCFDVESARDLIGTGQFAAQHQDEIDEERGQVMGGM